MGTGDRYLTDITLIRLIRRNITGRGDIPRGPLGIPPAGARAAAAVGVRLPAHPGSPAGCAWPHPLLSMSMLRPGKGTRVFPLGLSSRRPDARERAA